MASFQFFENLQILFPFVETSEKRRDDSWPHLLQAFSQRANVKLLGVAKIVIVAVGANMKKDALLVVHGKKDGAIFDDFVPQQRGSEIQNTEVNFPAQQSRQLDFEKRAEAEEIIRRMPGLESHGNIDVAQRPETAGICRAEEISQIQRHKVQTMAGRRQ
jgi:hypothetical protein